MYNKIATANFLDEMTEKRREEILSAVYDSGLGWEAALTGKELERLQELHKIEEG